MKPFSHLLIALLACGAFNAPFRPALSQTIADPTIARYRIPKREEAKLSHQQMLALVHQRIKYVFILYQENRSFDSYFGTFPGVEGLFSHPPEQTPGFYQPIENTDGSFTVVHPFRIGPQQYAADLGSVGHSHPVTLQKMNIVCRHPLMDRFVLTEEKRHTKGKPPSLAAKQYGELEMAYVDGDTIPFLWRYANRFVLCDHIFEEMNADSTPGNLCIIGTQSGLTQWLLHPHEAFKGDGGRGPGVPVVNDSNPFWGSPLDKTRTGRMPFNPKDTKEDSAHPERIQYSLTYATLMLTLGGRSLQHLVTADRDPKNDLRDVHQDITAIVHHNTPAITWEWYEEGFGIPDDHDEIDADGLHTPYVTHHNGPQYFGYISNNPMLAVHLHDLKAFFTDLHFHRLPPSGGVIYVKGGKRNIMGMQPADPQLRGTGRFLGDDDHPGDSDSQISEAFVAECINQIAKSPYWAHCAIIITWDDSEGDYDHVPPPLRAIGPDGHWLSDGPRVPLLFLSPYARTHYIAHASGDTASVVKFVDSVFGLVPLADLPAEDYARRLGFQRYHQANLGPFDDKTPHITDLLCCLDPARLIGRAAPLPPSYALIPENLIRHLPQQTGIGWRWAGIEPVDIQRHTPNAIPADFNPRPQTKNN